VDQLAVVGGTAYLRIRQHSGMVSSVVSALGTLRNAAEGSFCGVRAE